MTSPPLEQILLSAFGYKEFRVGQKRVIEQLVAGHSCAAIFPTGAGKSLCYQLPALTLPGLTLVISPLIALMKDQIDALTARGIAAARLDSTLTLDQYRDVMQRARRGELKLLYVAPERFINERFREALQSLRVSLFAVDEAHCISEWGHNFRPDYLKLPLFAKACRAERILALTATATPEVLKDICQAFAIDPDHATCTGFYRPNLCLLTQVVGAEQRDAELIAALKSKDPGSTIVYVTLQKTAEFVAALLVKAGFSAQAYHAGMDAEDRSAVQDWFIDSSSAIVVATIAFGMGIDKANIRYVYHYNLPKSLENYSQEIGRAGRDGQPSVCQLLLCSKDLNTLENFIYGDSPSLTAIRSLVTFVFSSETSFDLNLYELSPQLDIRSLVLGTLFTYLELQQFIESGTPFYADYQFKMIWTQEAVWNHFTGERQDFLKALFGCAKKSRIWSTLDIQSAISTLKTTRDRIIKALDYMSELGMIEVKASQMRKPYRILKRPAAQEDLVQTLYQQMMHREAREIDRLNQVVNWATLGSCQVAALGAHFGESREGSCGHCSFCLNPEQSRLPEQRAEFIAEPALLESARALHRQFPQLLTDEVALARFFCGISSPKLSRTNLGPKHPLFASLAEVPFKDILASFKHL